MTMIKSFNIGNHEIGNQSPALFLADIGTFFNQEIDQAFNMVDQLKDSGLDIIKGEILHNADICLKGDLNEVYLASGSQKAISENYRALIERKVVKLEDYEKIFEYCKTKELSFVLSVYDNEGADFAKSMGAVALKVSSSNITHFPLISYLAGLDLPIIIDTGHSTLAEAKRAVKWCHNEGETRIVIEHSPPAPPNDVLKHNLRFMLQLGKECNCYFGLSDHHRGEEMMLAATAMGAAIVEKGVYPDNLKDDQDVNHAMPITAVSNLKKQIQLISSALGTGKDRDLKGIPPYKSRMGIIAKTDISENDILTLNNVEFAFPALGIGTEHWPEVNGKKLIKPVEKRSPIFWQDIENSNVNKPAILENKFDQIKWLQLEPHREKKIADLCGLSGAYFQLNVLSEEVVGHYKIVTSDAEYFLKILPASFLEQSVLTNKIAAHLAAQNIDVCVMHSGCPKLINDGKHIAMSYNFIKAAYLSITPQSLYLLGKKLGQLHLHLKDIKFKNEIKTRAEQRMQLCKANTELLIQFLHIHNTDISEQLHKELSDDIQNNLINILTEAPQLIHGDLNFGNVLFEQSAEDRIFFLDFEETTQSYFTPCLDLAMVIERFILMQDTTDEGHKKLTKQETLIKALKRGYSETQSIWFNNSTHLQKLLKALAIRAMLLLIYEQQNMKPGSWQQLEFDKFISLYQLANNHASRLAI